MSYTMIPAGAVPNNRTSIYVTHHKRKWSFDDVVRVPTGHRSVLRFDCPDRTLHITASDGGKPDKKGLCPIRADSYDYALHFDPYSSISVHKKYTDRMLISALDGVKSGFVHRDYIDPSFKLMGDSGGAQMKLGVLKYVSPWMVIDWMNKMADEGACLDIAPRFADAHDNNILTRAAEVQNNNNSVFLREARKDLDLINVIHGFDLDGLRQWMDITHNSGFDGMAAGCDNPANALLCMRGILVPALEAQDEHLKKRLHLFGVSGGSTLPASIWLGKLLGDDVDFTTDSASWLFGCKHGMYANFDRKGALSWSNLVKKPSAFNHGSQLDCSCEVCGAIRWADVFRSGAYAPALAMSYHNLFTLKNYERFWGNLASKANNLNEFIESASSLGYKKIPEIIGAIKYVDTAFNEGLDEAEVKFSHLLSNELSTGVGMGMLFGSDEETGESSPQDGIDVEEDSILRKHSAVSVTEVGVNSITSILENFEESRIEEYIRWQDKPPPEYTKETGFLTMEKLDQERRIIERREAKLDKELLLHAEEVI